MEFKKLKDIYQKVKSFKFTKYFLDRKERKLNEEVTTKRNLIEHLTQSIVNYEENIRSAKIAIADLKTDVNLIAIDVMKIQTVLKLY